MVAQLGARRHYAVPLAFHSEGQLHSLCTDILVPTGWQQQCLRKIGNALRSQSIRRLADRRLAPALDDARITAFATFGLRYKLAGRRASSAEQRTANWLWGGQQFARLCADALDDRVGAVYAFTSAAKELFAAARDRGASCWLDYATAPRAFEVGLIREEADRFRGWAQRPVEDGLTDAYLDRQRDEVALADRIVCGSSFAKRAIEAEGAEPSRTLVVPLGLADHLFVDPAPGGEERRPEGLRVLFVGGDGLRKGIGYLEQALAILDRPEIQTRVAGNLELSDQALGMLSRRMEIMGTVARSEMPQLFRWADVLVLPSISDTFGMVILEAMAAGLPVIASENTSAPDIVREGTDGFVVPIRDPEAIARALDRFASDRSTAREMGFAARSRAADFTVSRYGQRLTAALGETERSAGEGLDA